MIEYFTSFNLVYPVIDYDAAVKYLTEDDMTQYTPKSLCKDILSIKWNLYDEQRGEVTLRTT